MTRNGTAPEPEYTLKEQRADLMASNRESARAGKELVGLARARPCTCEKPYVYRDEDGDRRCSACAKEYRP